MPAIGTIKVKKHKEKVNNELTVLIIMGKLKEIRKDFAELKENSKLLKEKVIELENYKQGFQELATKFNAIYENYFTPEQELSEADIKAQQEETVNMMKGVVRSAISDMLADPENQKNIQTFVAQFTGAMNGKGQGGWANLITEDGQVNWGIAIQEFMKKQNTSSPVAQTTTRGGKTTGY